MCKNKDKNRGLGIFLFCLVILVWAAFTVGPYYWDIGISVGDASSSFSALCSGLAFVGIIMTIRQQHQQISLQVEELRTAKTEQEKQTNEMLEAKIEQERQTTILLEQAEAAMKAERYKTFKGYIDMVFAKYEFDSESWRSKLDCLRNQVLESTPDSFAESNGEPFSQTYTNLIIPEHN